MSFFRLKLQNQPCTLEISDIIAYKDKECEYIPKTDHIKRKKKKEKEKRKKKKEREEEEEEKEKGKV